MMHTTIQEPYCCVQEFPVSYLYGGLLSIASYDILFSVCLLNVSSCPACGRRSAISRPFIYSDSAHNLLAYVHPRNDVPEEAQLLILDKLSNVYTSIVGDTEQHSDQENGGVNNGSKSAISLANQEQELPPLQVVFGADQLHGLINAVLSQEE